MQSATTDRHNVFLLLNNPSGTSFIGDVVTMEEVLNCSNEILKCNDVLLLRHII